MKDLLGKIATISGPGLDQPTECRGFEYTPDGRTVRWLNPDGKTFVQGVPIGSINVITTPSDDPDYVPAKAPGAPPPPKRRITLAEVPKSVREQILKEELAKREVAAKGGDGQSSEKAPEPTEPEQDAAGNPVKT